MCTSEDTDRYHKVIFPINTDRSLTVWTVTYLLSYSFIQSRGDINKISFYRFDNQKKVAVKAQILQS